AGDRMELRGHGRRDHVADVRPDEHAEQQVPGDPGELKPAQELAGDPRAEQCEADRQRGAGGRKTRTGSELVNPGDGGDGQCQRGDPRHASASGCASAAISDDATVPTTTTVRTGANAGPSARTTSRAKATPNAPGASTNRVEGRGAAGKRW